MQKNDKQFGTPFVDYTDTKSNIEALPNMRIGAHAVAIDNPTAPFGVYVPGGWVWYATGSTGGTSNHNSLSGLQGGTGSQYYHLGYNEWGGLVTGSLTYLHKHSAIDIVTGTMNPARLGSGTASSTKHLAGDSTWVDAPSAEINSENLYRCNSAFASGWTGTINGAPSGANVTVTTSTGNIASITPQSSSLLAKMRLYNTTRGNYALIQSVSGSVVTLTANAPAGWANGDSLTVISTTVNSGDGRNWSELEITSGVTKNHIFLEVGWTNTTAGKQCGVAPVETFSFAKAFFLTSAGQATLDCQPLACNLVFALSWQDAGSSIIVKYKGFLR